MSNVLKELQKSPAFHQNQPEMIFNPARESPYVQAGNSGSYPSPELLSGGKVNRLKKARRWRNFGRNTVSDAIDLADKALTVKDKHDPKSQILDAGLEMADDMNGSGLKSKVKKARSKAKKVVDDVEDYVEDKAKVVKKRATRGVKRVVNKAKDDIESQGKKVVKKAKKAVDDVDKSVVRRAKKTVDKVKGDVEGVVKEVKSRAKKTGKALSGGGVPRRPSAWISHVKAYASEHGISYKEALSKAKATYKK